MKNNCLRIFFAIGFFYCFVSPHFTETTSARVNATPTPTRAPTQKPTATPTPKSTMSPTPVPTPTPIQTLEELQSKIRQRMFTPEVRRGRIGIKIVSLNTGKVIFENDSDKYFIPASNMKNFTVATALETLGPDFKFVTSVYASSAPNATGTIKGDLRIFGRGDVSISTRFTDGDYYKRLDDLADKIVGGGVKRIEGGIIGDETYFSGDPVNGTWEVEDMESPDGAEISALPLNDNAVDISVRPGPVSTACSVSVLPLNTIIHVVNRCVTGAAGTKRDLRVVKLLNQNVLQFTGSMPVGDTEYKDSIAVTHPAELFIELLRQRLLQKGVTITGQNSVTNEMPRPVCPTCPVRSGIEIAKLESPPFSLIAAKTMKPSQNMYTETILWTLGEQSRLSAIQNAGQNEANGLSAKRPDSAALGLGVVKNFLKEIGLAPDGIVGYDGSGMSRRDLITPGVVIQLYTYMAKQSKYPQVWRDSLAIGGVDGTLTLRNRFVGTKAAGNLRGKTGTLSQVSALSGYISTAAGEQLVLSIIVNGVPEPRMRTSLIDDIVLSLANFNGRID